MMDSLNCVYLALFFVGVGYAVFLVLTGGLSDIDMPDVDVDISGVDLPGDVDIPGADIHIGGAEGAGIGIDAPDVSVSPLSPITIATFVTTFGGVGVLCTQLFACSAGISLIVSTVSGLAVGGLMYLFYSQFLVRSQGSSQIRSSELIGLQAEVTVPIGESSPGKVDYQTKTGRMSSMARSADGSPIPRGHFVRIVRMVGHQALVLPVEADSEGDQ
jgi:membrane protein implicated in regulation of membrane protease activity